jgi:hypothetical protein
VRVVQSEPQRRGGDADLAALAVIFAEPVEDLLGLPGSAEAYEGVQAQGTHRRDEVVRYREVSGLPFGDLQRGRRVIITSPAARAPADRNLRDFRSSDGSPQRDAHRSRR